MPFEQSNNAESEAIALMKSRLSGFETEAGRLKGLSYKTKYPGEVAITTTPKAGTTWMQQICHQIRSGASGGDMNFEEISAVVPWLELAYDQGQDLEAPQYGHAEGLPRLFKTHAWEEDCPDFPKVIVVLRNPEDVVLSFYRFFENWFFEAGSVSLDAFAREFWLARDIPTSKMQNASYFIHLTSWFKRKDDPRVLTQDLRTEVERVAQFISTDKHDFYKPQIIDVAVAKSSYAFMKEHEGHFDEKLSKSSRNEACGLPKDAGMGNSKIKKGSSGTGKTELSAELKQAIADKWKQVVEPVTGCSSYEELRTKLGRETRKS